MTGGVKLGDSCSDEIFPLSIFRIYCTFPPFSCFINKQPLPRGSGWLWHWLCLDPENELLGEVLVLVRHGGLLHVGPTRGAGTGVQLGVLFFLVKKHSGGVPVCTFPSSEQSLPITSL